MSDIPTLTGLRPPITQPGAAPAEETPSTPATSTPPPAMVRPIDPVLAAEEARARNPGGYVQPGGAPPSFGNTTSSAPMTPPPAVVEAEFAVLRKMLREFGLESIYDQVRSIVTMEMSDAEIQLKLRSLPEYQDRFKVIFEREKQGLPPMTAQDVVNFENELEKRFSLYGYPADPGENLQDVAADLMMKNVSLTEVEQRLSAQLAFGRQVLDDPENQGVAQELLGLGATLFDVANFALDPDNTLEQVQRRLTAAAVANEAIQTTNYSDITADEAMELARQGVDAEQAQRGFGTLQQQTQVVDRLIGDTSDPVTREQELAAIAGNVEAQAAIERSAQRRVAAATVGGSFATDDEGFGGLR